MEMKDLMISDWVLISVWDCNPFPSKVTSINYNSYQGKDFVDWIDTEDEESFHVCTIFGADSGSTHISPTSHSSNMTIKKQ